MRRRFALLSLIMIDMITSTSVSAMTDAQLTNVVALRLKQDRTGACLAVAVVDGDQVARTFTCATDSAMGRIGPDSTFEIGSISKTMTAALLAEMIQSGQASLDDPLSEWVPPGTKVPALDGKSILLRHIVSHTSGLPALPSFLQIKDVADPYADLSEQVVWSSLAASNLLSTPGSRYEYSNFAMMVLSAAISRRAGTDYESLLRERLLVPLGMHRAYVNSVPSNVTLTLGHTANGLVTSPWNTQTDIAGFAGVHATLDDMVSYVQGSLADGGAPIHKALALTHQEVTETPSMGISWMRIPVKERIVLVHEGGTGGFSAFVALDPDRKKGVVVLSDTAWTSLGGLGAIGMHLIDPRLPIGMPRRERKASPRQLAELKGDYLLGELKVRLDVRDGMLVVQPENQPALMMGHDDAGDYYPKSLDALLTPVPTKQGLTFVWKQGGGSVTAKRVDGGAPARAATSLTHSELAAYVGTYPLSSEFSLSVVATEKGLTVQGTGQQALTLDSLGEDQFDAREVEARLMFSRDSGGNIEAVILHQGGQSIRAKRE